jgi:hypothetical protein
MLSIKINSSASVGDIYPHLLRHYHSLNLLEESHQLTHLLFYRYSDRTQKITDILPYHVKLNNIQENSTIYAVELLNHHGKAKIQNFYNSNWSDL